MNKIGFGELLIILVIALVVLGPEKLPQAARALGKAIGSVKKYVREASEELELDELKQIKKDVDGIQKDLKTMGTSLEKTLTDEAEKTEQEIEAVTKDVNDAVEKDPAPAKAKQPAAAAIQSEKKDPSEDAAAEPAAEPSAENNADAPESSGEQITTTQEE